MLRISRLLVSAAVFLLHIKWLHAEDDFLSDQFVCTPSIIDYENGTHKQEYRVGVLAIRGFEAAYREFNSTFSDYLTATAGTKFSQPIKFTLVPLNFLSLFSDVELAAQTGGEEGVDFIYVNPSAFSCIESEYGSNTLVSQISRRVVEGQVYELTKFGGVIFTRHDNAEINEVEDLRNKSVACASISGLGSGQMQFRLMEQRGLAYIQDPKQLVFTSNQGKVVNGVLQGNFEVGFVRTDQIERTIDARTGELVNKTELKIINGGFEMLDGEPFPFESSTILYPEWNVGSLSHVNNDVAIEVQSAMLAIEAHAAVGASIDDCLKASNCTTPIGSACYTLCIAQVDNMERCDSTPELAALALQAKTSGKYAGWRSTLSYMELRNMQEETNFIRKEEDGINRCIRSSQIVDAVVCPPGHFKKPDDEVLSGCADAGLDCGDYQCLCKPCVKAFDVDVFPVEEMNQIEDGACSKFAICGTVEQSYGITFRAVDNKARDDMTVRVRVLEGANEMDIPVTKSQTTNFTYDFSFDATGSETGIVIFEVYADEEQIPESPFRMVVAERDCAEETGDALQEADPEGQCVCQNGSSSIGGNCVLNSILIPSIVIPLMVLLALSVYFYVEHKKSQADSVWAVKPDELVFDDPPAILGRGTFGLVLLAEYRGTQVAVKRVIPPKLKRKNRGNGTESGWRNDMLGDGDVGEFDEIPEQRANIQFDFDPVGLHASQNGFQTSQNGGFDAMESGTGKRGSDQNSIQEDITVQSSSSTTKRPRRRASLTGKDKATNNLFDFANMQNSAGQQKSYGLESGGMQRVMEHIQTESGGTAPKGRRHSIADLGRGGGMESTMAAAAAAAASLASDDDDDDNVKQPLRMKPKRRGSGGSVPEAERRTGDSFRSKPMRRRHSLGGTVAAPDPLLPAFSFTGRLKKSEKAEERSVDRQSSIGSLSNRPGRRESDASWDSVKGPEFTRMIMEEEQEVALKASTTTGAIKSGSYGLKSGRSSQSNSLQLESGSGSRPKIMLKRISEQVFGKGDEYARLRTEFVSEMRHLSKLRHPCITTVMGAVISKRSEPMLVMEYMDHGSLYDILHNESMVVDGELVLPILRDIAQGVRFLHAASPRVIHGDLKAQNVLVDSKFRAKVADFGLSQKKKVGATGTPLWMAPELLRGEGENTAMSDVYSFGIILYEVYSRKDPYDGEDHLSVLQQVADPQINKRPPIPSTCPAKISSIMTDCLGGDPENRPTFEELDLRLKRLDVENVEPGQTIFSMQKKKEQRAQRNEELLFDVFPRHVAEALRDGRKLEAESFDCVTIFFSDIVGYTTISSKLHPRKVSDMLDRLYLKFDSLSDKHDIFKIETIGDAYMAVTNLHKDQDDHASRMALFSIDAVVAANETLIDMDDPAKGYVQIRVGFHSGPIVADVVGSRCPKYTLFGDTVNTASRMESNSLPGRIQCSDRTATMIKEQDISVPVIHRGKINVKGKGEMITSWIGELSTKAVDMADVSALSANQEQSKSQLVPIVEGTGKD